MSELLSNVGPEKGISPIIDTNVTVGYAGVQEVQTITLPAGAIGGSWDINGIGSFAFDADAWTVQNYLDSTLATAISVTGGWGAYYLTWPSPGPQDLVAVSTAGLQFPTVAEQTAGAAGYDELRSFVYSTPTGSGAEKGISPI